MTNSLPAATSSSPRARGHERRRRPGHRGRPLRLPHRLAGLGVERGDERRLAAVLVALQDDQVLVEHRRARRAHAQRLDVADVDLPQQLAGEVVGEDALGAEVGEDPGAVGDRRRRGVAAPLVPAVVDRPLVGHLLPAHRAGVERQRDHLVGVLPVGAQRVGVHELRGRLAGVLLEQVDRGLGARQRLAFDRRRQKDVVAPDDWRRVAEPGNGGLPRDVGRRAPGRRQRRLVRDALAVRAAELRPVSGLDGGAEGERGQRSGDGVS